jgi:two-component system response regulator FlrC
VLATTNRDLKEYVKEGKFREDLYYRLSVFPMMWKPLRERPLDIWPLAERLLEEHSQKMKRSPMNFAGDVQAYLTQYAWPGNVRELDNAIQRSLILASNGVVRISDFCLDMANASSWILESTDAQVSSEENEPDSIIEVELDSGSMSGLGKDLKLKEYQIIIDTLKQENGRKKNAAEKLGISPRTLRYKLAQMRDNGIDVRAKLSA